MAAVAAEHRVPPAGGVAVAGTVLAQVHHLDVAALVVDRATVGRQRPLPRLVVGVGRLDPDQRVVRYVRTMDD